MPILGWGQWVMVCTLDVGLDYIRLEAIKLWGLAGMQERAPIIGKLKIMVSSPG